MTDTTLSALQKKFNLPGVAAFSEGNGGQTKLSLTAPSAKAELYLHGAHVTHFQPNGEEPVLFVSSKSAFAPGKPIRGGVPLCWPWFGPRADDPSAAIHGFARLMDWNVEAIQPRGESLEIKLGLHDSAATHALFPHKFKLNYTVTVGRKLTLALETTNLDNHPFTFTEAMHPYFVISDIRKIEIVGLENTSYSEKIYSPDVQKQGADAIRFDRRTDRVYYDTRKPLLIRDPGRHLTIQETKEGSNTTVVWNPWSEWPRTVPDFGHDEWPNMVCVEPSNAHQFAVTLSPGQSHTLKATFEVTR